LIELNKIYNEDCLETMKRMEDDSVDMVLTDPPYGINYQSNMRTVSEKFNHIQNDDSDFRFKAYKEIYRTLNNNSVAVIFCSFKNYADDWSFLIKKFDIKNVIIWNKGGGGIGDLEHSLLTDYEMAMICHKGKRKINGKRIGSVWYMPKVNPNIMIHPTEKPAPLFQKLIQYYSNYRDVIYDAFIGGGTTAIAAIKEKRNWIGSEISKEYCDIAQKRINIELSQMKLF